jgi:hypothetical protein
MEVHVCLLFDADDAIIDSATIVTAKSGAEARAKAFALLRETAGARGFELWRDGHKVYTHVPGRNEDSAS